MPIYEYVCAACRHRFETLVFGSERPECPRCASTALEKQLSVFGVATRGSEGRPGGEAFGPGPCGTCGDPRGPGACDLD